jgi:DNA-binding NarL/FixJ family response regulator
MTSVVLVDGHVLFREGLHSLLSLESDFDVVGQASRLTPALELIASRRPDLVLIGSSLPDGGYLAAVPAILAASPVTSVVVLSTEDSDECAFEAIQLGANGFLPRDTPFAALLAALRGLQHGELAMSRAMSRHLIDKYRRNGASHALVGEPVDELTTREQQILHLLGKGLCNQDIARQLVISEHTVKVHVHNLLAKLGMSSRSQAATYARHYGLHHLPLGNLPD